MNCSSLLCQDNPLSFDFNCTSAGCLRYTPQNFFLATVAEGHSSVLQQAYEKKHKPLVCSRTGLLYLGYIRRLRFTSQAHNTLLKGLRQASLSLLQLSLLLPPWQQPRTFAIWLKRASYSYLPFWNLRLSFWLTNVSTFSHFLLLPSWKTDVINVLERGKSYYYNCNNAFISLQMGHAESLGLDMSNALPDVLT